MLIASQSRQLSRARCFFHLMGRYHSIPSRLKMMPGHSSKSIFPMHWPWCQRWKEDLSPQPKLIIGYHPLMAVGKNNALLDWRCSARNRSLFGQGTNAGFEDCRVLNDLLDQYQDGTKFCPNFSLNAGSPTQMPLHNWRWTTLLRCAICWWSTLS